MADNSIMSTIKRKNLDEVSFIRPILIVLLVLVHSFTVFNDGWPPFEGYVPCEAYKWISRFSYSFMLETFIFVSGYVYAFQKFELGKNDSFKKLLSKKAQRLLFPSIVFSIFYAQLINGNNLLDSAHIGASFLSVLSGVGHMWYLPVLLWCFVAIYLVNKVRLNKGLLLFAFGIMAILPLPSLPFQLYRLPYYFFFFYLGQVFWLNREKYFSKLPLKKIITIWLVFVLVFVGLRIVKANVMELADGNVPLLQKVTFNIISKSCQIVYATLGMTAIYVTGIFVTSKYKLPDWYICLGNFCFGVYIFQEFILKYLYYFSELPKSCSPHIIPWVCFIITIVLSLCLSKATKYL